jgi:hypothetical protein
VSAENGMTNPIAIAIVLALSAWGGSLLLSDLAPAAESTGTTEHTTFPGRKPQIDAQQRPKNAKDRSRRAVGSQEHPEETRSSQNKDARPTPLPPPDHIFYPSDIKQRGDFGF